MITCLSMRKVFKEGLSESLKNDFAIAISVYIMLFLAPIAVFVFLRVKYEQLDRLERVSSFGSLYEGLRNKFSILTWAAI